MVRAALRAVGEGPSLPAMIELTCLGTPEAIAPLDISRIDLTCRRHAGLGTCQDVPQSRQVLVYSRASQGSRMYRS